MAAQGENAGEDVVDTFDDVLSDAAPVVKRCRLSLRGDLVSEIEDLEVRLEEAQVIDQIENRTAEAPAIAQRIIELTEEARRHEREFAFQSIGRKAWRDLVAEHPPTPDEREKGIDFNRETLPPAAMAASCIRPSGASVEKFEQLRDSDKIGDIQWNRLWLTCRAANVGGADIPLSEAAFAMVRGTGSSAESPAPTDSPAASS